MVAGVFMLAFLMVSTIRYSSLKYLTLGRKSHLTILILAFLLALIYFYSKPTLLAVAVLYALSGVAVRLFNLIRRRKPVEELPFPTPAEPH